MTYGQLFKQLEDKQRYMTSNRHLFTHEEIETNGLLILAVEAKLAKPPRKGKVSYLCPNTQCLQPLGRISVIRKITNMPDIICCMKCGQKINWRGIR